MQKEYLARMYRLFNRIKNGLDPVALIFRKHVESEGMKIVNQATEDATAKKEKDAGVCDWKCRQCWCTCMLVADVLIS